MALDPLIPIAALAVAAAIAALLGVSIQPAPIPWMDLLDRFLIALLFVALGEEPAWRGFLQPMLQRRMSVVAATFCVAAVWAVWHAPLMGSEFKWVARDQYTLFWCIYAGVWAAIAIGICVALPRASDEVS